MCVRAVCHKNSAKCKNKCFTNCLHSLLFLLISIFVAFQVINKILIRHEDRKTKIKTSTNKTNSENRYLQKPFLITIQKYLMKGLKIYIFFPYLHHTLN